MPKETENNRGLGSIKAAKLQFIKSFWGEEKGEENSFVDEMIAMQGPDRVVELQFPAILNAIKQGPTPKQIRNYPKETNTSMGEIDALIKRAGDLLDKCS